LWGGGCGGHGREKNMDGGLCQARIPLAVSMIDRGRRRSARYPVCPDTVGVTAP
jgi:hypothetical protein